jgi:hypothetical protein
MSRLQNGNPVVQIPKFGMTAMTETPGHTLIASDRVEGTSVYDPAGNKIGTIRRLMIEKITGRVAYAVLSFGGFLGMGGEEHALPWNKLKYDTKLAGYRTDITEAQLRGAPAPTRESANEHDLHEYLRRVGFYWGAE